jgi:hypothetical protein
MARSESAVSQSKALVFPPELQDILGASGISLALWSIQRRREGKPMHPDAAKSDK